MNRAETLKVIAAEWRSARRIYPVFLGIGARFSLDIQPLPELESPVDRSEPEVVARVRQWVAHADEWIQVHHLRHFLQSSSLSNEASLRALIGRYLGKDAKTESDRDKLDFLLVQYFSQCAPSHLLVRDVGLDEVAEVLEPALDVVIITNLPGWLEPLEDILRRVRQCRTMRELLHKGILQEARKLKKSADEAYFNPSVLVAFVRFNFMVRQAFFRLMRADLEAVRHGLHALAGKGVTAINCKRAQLSATEPADSLMQMILHWKNAFHAEYAAGRSFEQLSEIRAAVEDAMVQHGIPVPEPAAPVVLPAAPPPAHFAAPYAAAAVATTGHGAAQRAGAEFFTGAEQGDDLLQLDGPPALAATPPPQPPALQFAAPPQQGVAAELQLVLDHLVRSLPAEARKSPDATTTLVFGAATLAISSWELKAFTEGLDDFTEPAQRAVAVRVFLFQTIEQVKKGAPRSKLKRVAALAHAEAARLQDAIVGSRDERNIEATVTMSATSQRLLSAIADAENLLNAG